MESRSLLVRDLAENELKMYYRCQTDDDRMICLERIRALRNACLGGGLVTVDYNRDINWNLKEFGKTVFKKKNVYMTSSLSDVNMSVGALETYLKSQNVDLNVIQQIVLAINDPAIQDFLNTKNISTDDEISYLNLILFEKLEEVKNYVQSEYITTLQKSLPVKFRFYSKNVAKTIKEIREKVMGTSNVGSTTGSSRAYEVLTENERETLASFRSLLNLGRYGAEFVSTTFIGILVYMLLEWQIFYDYFFTKDYAFFPESVFADSRNNINLFIKENILNILLSIFVLFLASFLPASFFSFFGQKASGLIASAKSALGGTSEGKKLLEEENLQPTDVSPENLENEVAKEDRKYGKKAIVKKYKSVSRRAQRLIPYLIRNKGNQFISQNEMNNILKKYDEAIRIQLPTVVPATLLDVVNLTEEEQKELDELGSLSNLPITPPTSTTTTTAIVPLPTTTSTVPLLTNTNLPITIKEITTSPKAVRFSNFPPLPPPIIVPSVVVAPVVASTPINPPNNLVQPPVAPVNAPAPQAFRIPTLNNPPPYNPRTSLLDEAIARASQATYGPLNPPVNAPAPQAFRIPTLNNPAPYNPGTSLLDEAIARASQGPINPPVNAPPSQAFRIPTLNNPPPYNPRTSLLDEAIARASQGPINPPVNSLASQAVQIPTFNNISSYSSQRSRLEKELDEAIARVSQQPISPLQNNITTTNLPIASPANLNVPVKEKICLDFEVLSQVDETIRGTICEEYKDNLTKILQEKITNVTLINKDNYIRDRIVKTYQDKINAKVPYTLSNEFKEFVLQVVKNIRSSQTSSFASTVISSASSSLSLKSSTSSPKYSQTICNDMERLKENFATPFFDCESRVQDFLEYYILPEISTFYNVPTISARQVATEIIRIVESSNVSISNELKELLRNYVYDFYAQKKTR